MPGGAGGGECGGGGPAGAAQLPLPVRDREAETQPRHHARYAATVLLAEFIFFNIFPAGIDCLQRLYCTDWGPVVAARSLGLVATEAATPLKKLIMQHAS